MADVSGWLYDSLAERIQDTSGDAVLSELNRKSLSFGARAVATAAVVAYYRGEGVLHYAYAGHPPAFVHRVEGGGWQPVELSGSDATLANLPLAVLEDVRYDQGTVPLGPGDRVLLYTDGLIEARDHTGSFFGRDGLGRALAGLEGGTTNEVVHGVLGAAEAHAGGELVDDDVTLVVFEVQ